MRKFGKESAAPTKGDEGRRRGDSGWFRNHWCLVSLCVIVIVAFLLRTVFVYGLSADGGFALSGGSNAQNHLHVVESILNGTFAIGTDAAVNYPLGGLNVVPPLMDYLAAAVACLLGAFGMETSEAASAALAVLPPIFGALACIPVYAIAKELFDKRIGVVAALIFAFLALPISSSVFSNGTEYALTAFLIACMSFLLVRTVKLMESGAAAKSVYISSLVCGVFMGLIALAWNGFGLMVLIVAAPMLLQIVVDRVRGKDFTMTLVGHTITLIVGIALAAVYYIPAGLWDAVFSGPFLLAILTIVFGFLFKALAGRPWITTIPLMFVILAVVLVALFFGAPEMFSALVYGNPIYTGTMADLVSDHISMSNVSSYYGWLTMWLPICLALYETYVYIKKDRSASRLFMVTWLYLMFFAVWSGYSSAAVVGSVFAVGSAAVIVMVLERANLREWVKSIRTAGFPSGFRKLIKPLPFASVLITALLVIAPNFTYAVDAGMSNNIDGDHSFSGNTQFVVKTGDSYPVGNVWNHYADQEKDGAAVIWLDYVADALAQGDFSTIADSYGEGAEATAQMILANGSVGMTAAMMVRLIMCDVDKYESAFPAELFAELKSYIADADKARAAIADDPELYGDIRASISDENAVYLACIEAISAQMDQKSVTVAYDIVRNISGKSIDYVILDTSLLPISYGGGDSFASMAYFAGYDTDSYGAVPEFFSYNTSYGYTTYTDAMYETFLWKALVGPSAKDAGFSSSYSYLYSLSMSDGSTVAMPGYGLAGYTVDYWQVMYNADSKATSSSDGWEYMPIADAVAKQKADGGLINYLSSMVVLKYVGVGSPVDGDATFEGLTVEAYIYDDLASAYKLAAVDVTDKDGKFQLAIDNADTSSVKFVVKNGSYVLASAVGSVPTIDSNYNASASATVCVGEVELKNSGMNVTLSNVATGKDVFNGAVDNNGLVTINNLVAGEYNVTLTNSAGDNVSTSTVTLAPGDNKGMKITVKSYDITVTVKNTDGMLVEAYDVVATDADTGVEFTAKSGNDGKAVIAVLPGTYSISADYCASYPSVTVSKSNTTSSIVIFKAHEVCNADVTTEYPVFAYAGGVSYQIVDDKITVPKTDATEKILYTIYGTNGTDKVTLGIYEFVRNSVNKASFSEYDAVKVSGTIDAGATVAFINSVGATVKTVADSEGKFSVLLPAGQYTVHADNGKDKALITSVDVATGMTALDLKLDDGRAVSLSVKYQSGTSSGYINQPFVYVKAVVNTDDTTTVDLYGMTDSNGKATFIIPDNKKVKLIAGNDTGTFTSNSFKVVDFFREVTAGPDDSSNTLYIYNKTTIPTDPESKEDYVLPVNIKADHDVKLTSYSDKDRVYDLKAGVAQEIIPGQYTAKISTDKLYFDGTVYIYPDDDTNPDNNEIIGLKPVDVVKVTIEKNEGDVITVEHEGGDYWKDGDDYWFQLEDENKNRIIYTIKSVNTTGDEKKVAYGSVNTAHTAAGTTIDVKAVDVQMTVTGSIGVVADGTITIEKDSVELPFDVEDGQYTLTLPVSWTDVRADVDVETELYGYDWSYIGGWDLTGLADGAVRNIPVVTDVFMPAGDSELELNISLNNVYADRAELTVALSGGESNLTYLLTPGDAWSFATVAIKNGESVNIVAYFNEKGVSMFDEGLTITASDINGKDSVTVHAPFGIVDNTCAPEITFDANDVITASQYRYAIKIDNSGNMNAVNAEIILKSTIDTTKWAVTYTNGLQVNNDGKFVVPANEPAYMVFVCLMSLDGTGAVPDITVDITAGATTKSDVLMEAEDLNLTVDDMNVSGGDALNDRSGVPVGVWFMLAVGLFLVVAAFYLASKRGVFSRRK